MSSTAVGNWLEDQVFNFLSTEVKNGSFMCKPEFCKVYRKKGYYSEKRKSEIIFDVSIEITMPGASDYSLLILVECKNYKHSVPVNDLEEFSSKIEQVLGSKGILITNAELQSGALNFAKSSKIAFVRFVAPGDLKWILYRSPSVTMSKSPESQRYKIEQALITPSIERTIFDIYAISAGVFTSSWLELFQSLLGFSETEDLGIPKSIFSEAISSCVPYLSKDFIRCAAAKLLLSVQYEGGPISLIKISEKEHSLSGLKVVNAGTDSPFLGCIDFYRNEIGVPGGLHGCDERGRFTLSHEFGHFYLGHAKYMSREGAEISDMELANPISLEIEDIRKLEWQANYFASCLLLPDEHFTTSFFSIANRIGLVNKGYGPLFLDDQLCNQEHYFHVSDYLKGKYKVSRAAVEYKLKELELMNDVRGCAKTDPGLLTRRFASNKKY